MDLSVDRDQSPSPGSLDTLTTASVPSSWTLGAVEFETILDALFAEGRI
jgi:hypothetical protein